MVVVQDQGAFRQSLGEHRIGVLWGTNAFDIRERNMTSFVHAIFASRIATIDLSSE